MTTLKTFDFAASGTRQNYDWKLLTDGRIHQLEKGKDYNAKYMAAQIRVYAKQHGLTCKVTTRNFGKDDEFTVVQFEKMDTKKKNNKKTVIETTEV